jgi:hypothetical protein
MGQITIRLKDDDEKKLKIEAEKNNLSLAEFCRCKLLERKINHEENNKNNSDNINDNINNGILKANSNIIKSHTILNGKLYNLETQINTILYFILLLIKLFTPSKFEEAKKILETAKYKAEKEQKNKEEQAK